MTTMKALQAYFNEPPLSNAELLQLKRELPPAEYDKLGQDTCAVLGEPWEQPKKVA